MSNLIEVNIFGTTVRIPEILEIGRSNNKPIALGIELSYGDWVGVIIRHDKSFQELDPVAQWCVVCANGKYKWGGTSYLLDKLVQNRSLLMNKDGTIFSGGGDSLTAYHRGVKNSKSEKVVVNKLVIDIPVPFPRIALSNEPVVLPIELGNNLVLGAIGVQGELDHCFCFTHYSIQWGAIDKMGNFDTGNKVVLELQKMGKIKTWR